MPENAPETPRESPFAQFEQLVKKVVSVPKDQIDALSQKEKQQKEKERANRIIQGMV